MAKTAKYDVFLSYRREGGFEIATLLHDSPTRQGYRVFMDCQGLHSGKFDEQLYSVIDGVKEDVSGFLKQLEQLAKAPRQAWLANTRKVVELQGKMAQELMVGAYYSFLELIAGMPPGARAVFLQAKAFVTRFPAADPSWGAAEFKSLQERSLQRAGELEHDTALLIGGDGAVMDRVEKQVKKLAKRVASGDANARGYAAAATRYYSAVLENGLPAHGILMVGTKDDRPHPVLQKGDVVLERKGKTIRSADEYFALEDDPAPNVVRLIRFDEKGEPRFLNETIPASDVLVGFVDLWDDPSTSGRSSGKRLRGHPCCSAWLAMATLGGTGWIGKSERRARCAKESVAFA